MQKNAKKLSTKLLADYIFNCVTNKWQHTIDTQTKREQRGAPTKRFTLLPSSGQYHYSKLLKRRPITALYHFYRNEGQSLHYITSIDGISIVESQRPNAVLHHFSIAHLHQVSRGKRVNFVHLTWSLCYAV